MSDEKPVEASAPAVPQASAAPPPEPPQAGVPTMDLLAPDAVALTASGALREPESIILPEPPPADEPGDS